MVDILLRRKCLKKHLIVNLAMLKSKSSTDNNLYPTKVNVIDPTKHNFTEPLSDHTLSMYDRGPEDFCGAHEIF